jgi:hypothetical protein
MMNSNTGYVCTTPNVGVDVIVLYDSSSSELNLRTSNMYYDEARKRTEDLNADVIELICDRLALPRIGAQTDARHRLMAMRATELEYGVNWAVVEEAVSSLDRLTNPLTDEAVIVMDIGQAVLKLREWVSSALTRVEFLGTASRNPYFGTVLSLICAYSLDVAQPGSATGGVRGANGYVRLECAVAVREGGTYFSNGQGYRENSNCFDAEDWDEATFYKTKEESLGSLTLGGALFLYYRDFETCKKVAMNIGDMLAKPRRNPLVTRSGNDPSVEAIEEAIVTKLERYDIVKAMIGRRFPWAVKAFREIVINKGAYIECMQMPGVLIEANSPEISYPIGQALFGTGKNGAFVWMFDSARILIRTLIPANLPTGCDRTMIRTFMANMTGLSMEAWEVNLMEMIPLYK